MNLSETSSFLQTYSGRDKFIRILCYSSKLISGLTSDKELARKYGIFSSQLSACRMTLRLFDDLPMLKSTLDYGFGKEEPDKFIRILSLLENFIDTIFYPVEHIEWAASRKIISINPDPWSTANTICWVLSLYLGMIKSARHALLIQYQKGYLNQVDTDVSKELKKIKVKQRQHLITVLKCMADLVHAIHWLPPGVLWSGKLEVWHVGALGTISSILSLYQAIQSVKAKRKES